MCRKLQALAAVFILCISYLLVGCSGGGGNISQNKPKLDKFVGLAEREKLTEEELKNIVDQLDSAGVADRISGNPNKSLGTEFDMEFKKDEYFQTKDNKEKKFLLSLLINSAKSPKTLESMWIKHGTLNTGICIWKDGKPLVDLSNIFIDKSRYEEISSKVKDYYVEYLKENNKEAELTGFSPITVQLRFDKGLFFDELVYFCRGIATYKKVLYASEENVKQEVKIDLDSNTLKKIKIHVSSLMPNSERVFLKLLASFSFK